MRNAPSGETCGILRSRGRRSASCSPARAVLTAVSALAAVLVLAAYLVTPPAERVSAQDGGTATAAGRLVVVPSVVEAGQTTLAVGFHVDPMDLEVVIEYSEHFTPEGESCDTAGTAGATQAAVAPTWITLNACSVGDGYVRMVDSETGDVIKDVSVTVIQPDPTREPRGTTIAISGLTSSELVPGGSGDPFSVIVTGLDSNIDHELNTIVVNDLSAAFNQGCTRFSVATSIISVPSFTQPYTVYGCVAPGNMLWSWVEDSNGTAIASTRLFDNEVNVAAPKVSFNPSRYSVDEGEEVEITVELTHRSSHNIRIPIDVSDDSALRIVGGLSADRLSFANHSTSQEFIVMAIDDDDFDDETVTLSFGTLPSTVMNTTPPSIATVRIQDDDENVDPVITDGPDSVSYAECGDGPVATYSASDYNGDPIRWSLQSTNFETDRTDFDIDEDEDEETGDGVLEFDNVPNFEDPDDHNGDNIYKITVHASDGNGGSDHEDVTVTVTNLNPTIDPGQESKVHAEGRTVKVARFSATDPCGADFVWSLPATGHATDQVDFEISEDGDLSFINMPDFENPHDSNRRNDYKVTVMASDGNLPASLSDSIDVTVTVTDVNESPDIAGPTEVDYAENRTDAVATYTADDPEDDDITWFLLGTDRDLFEISADQSSGDGILIFDEDPDFENPAHADNEYEITVQARDVNGNTNDIDVTVTVTDVNESPDITVPSLPDYDENGTGAVATFVAVDPEGATIEWTLPDTTHATDWDDFEIDQDGELTFMVTPDFESPHDSNGRNDYKVTIRASDGSLATSVNVTITVADVNERPVPDSTIANQMMTASVFRIISLQGTFSDPDGDTLTYSASTTPPGIATASVNNNDSTLTLTAVSVGMTTITVTAADRRSSTDADRLTATQDFTVTVEPNAPARVTGLTGSPGSVRGTINLDWDPADRAEDYEVEQRRRRFPVLPFEHWVLLTTSEVTIDAANASAVVRGLVGGETYRHRVRGIRGTGSSRVEGLWSVELETTLTLPDKVTGLTGMPGTNHGEINLGWDMADGASGYQVRQSESGSDWVVLSPRIAGFNINGTTAVVGDLDPDETYRYQVRGTNVHGEGEWSDATPPIAARDERPDKPTGLDANHTIGFRGFFLDWHAAAGAAGYEVGITPSASDHEADVTGETAIVTGLTPETDYAFRVRAWKIYRGSRLHSLWSDTVRRDGPRPASIGHQEDHTVEYAMGTITAAPNLPVGIPDPVAAIKAAINPAVVAWNTAAATITGKNITICAFSSCAGRNHDGWIVTVKTVANNTKDTGATDGGAHDEGCGRSVACVKASVADDHLRGMSLIIEEPAWECRGRTRTSACMEHAKIYWTDEPMHHGAKIIGLTSGNPPSYFYYINPTMIHEFGHTLGLHDFYNDPTMEHLTAVMNTHSLIEDEDEKQLEAIYAYHDSASH